MATYRLNPVDWVFVSNGNAYSNDRTSDVVTLSTMQDLRGMLFVRFEPLPESLWYKSIERASLVGYYRLDGVDSRLFFDCRINVAAENDDLDFASLTYNNMPGNGSGIASAVFDEVGPWTDWLPALVYTSDYRDLLTKPLSISGYFFNASGPLAVWTPKSSNPPYIEVTYYVDARSELTDISPTSGYVPKGFPTVFSWRVQLEEFQFCFGEIKQTAGVFRWREKGSGTVNSIDCGALQQCEVPAGTFSADEIEWSIEVTTNTGQTHVSDWYTLSTVEALSEAVPISPVSTMVDGSAPCKFSWAHNIATSTAQTAADLQYHTGDGLWQALGHVSGDSTEYTVPANTFSSGSVFWRVRTYNTDSTAGDWSDPVEIIVVAAPPAPVVQVTSGSAPRVSISWQSTDQQAWEAVVAGISSGIVYGLAKGWRLPDYLPDGTYTAKVRVCNKYNLWSPWGSCSVQVSNAVGEAIVLTAADGVAVSLRWASSGYDAYYVLRDGRPIAKTTEQSYTDNFCSGSHTYTVRGVIAATGMYGLSNAATAASTCETVCISPVPNAKWLRLRYADTSDRRTSLNTSRTVNYQYLPGAEYPSAEISEWTSATMSVQCAFASPAESAELEALQGSLVCVKDRRGNCAIGVLEALDKQSLRFFDSFSFSIQRVNYVEEVTYD